MQELSCARKRSPRRPPTRRCLLKGCEQRFHPRQARQRYCSQRCREAARKWSRHKAQERYRETVAGHSEMLPSPIELVKLHHCPSAGDTESDTRRQRQRASMIFLPARRCSMTRLPTIWNWAAGNAGCRPHRRCCAIPNAVLPVLSKLRRFDCKVFLTDALRYMGGATR
jgi:hypothetical protein